MGSQRSHADHPFGPSFKLNIPSMNALQFRHQRNMSAPQSHTLQTTIPQSPNLVDSMSHHAQQQRPEPDLSSSLHHQANASLQTPGQDQLPEELPESPIPSSPSLNNENKLSGNTPNEDERSSLAVALTNPLIPVPTGQRYVDITEYLNMPQTEAARKLDKEITTLLHNVPQGPGAAPLPEDIETALGFLLRKRQAVLQPVVIRI